ncbi:hypothetical protein Hanom_Chr06g00577711 [Helianthus anomalus]
MILENKVNACLMVKPDTRGTLIKFMQLMVSHHPSRRRFVVVARMIPEASEWKTEKVKWRFVYLCSCNMFDEHVYEIERLILIVLWIYNMKHWRFEEVWGLRS